MAVQFVLGRAGTGKTRRCLDALAAELAKPEDRRLLLLVPEQASFQMERALALRAPRHGYWRAEVLSFSRLAWRIFDELGCGPDELVPAAREMALRVVVRQSPAGMAAFGRAARTRGFFAQLSRLIEALLLDNVSPAALREAAGRAPPAVRARGLATAELYERFLAWLGPQRCDPAQRLETLRVRLDEINWLRDASIWVDGFAGFTGQELETLLALARRAREVTITLLLDPAAPAVANPRRPPDVLDLFHRTQVTYQRLLSMLRDAGVELRAAILLQPPTPPRFAQNAVLAQLEAGLATPLTAAPSAPPPTSEPAAGGAVGMGRTSRASGSRAEAAAPTLWDLPPPRPAPAGDVRIVACQTRRDEVHQAARYIRRVVIESAGKLRFRDFALIARDLTPLAALVADVFAEYEIPFFVDRRRPLAAHALGAFVQALFEVVQSDFAATATIGWLQSGLLPLRRSQAERLENVIRRNELAGLETWRQPHWPYGGGRGSPRPRPDKPWTARLDAARVAIAAAAAPLVLASHRAPPPTGSEWAVALYAVLRALRVGKRLAGWMRAAQQRSDWETAEVHRLAWAALCDALDHLHDVLAGTPLELSECAEVVTAALCETTVGLSPPTLDQVLVSAIERSRHPDIKYAWLFAFNDGVFPAPAVEEPILSAAERDALASAGLEGLRPRRHDLFAERLLAYIALTRPAHGLTISYATAGDDGQPQFPSPLLGDVKAALPGVVEVVAGDDDPPVCVAELAWGRVATACEADGSLARARYSALCGRLRDEPGVGPALERLVRGLTYTNRTVRLPEELSAGGLRGRAVSVSELNAYLRCPFQHFARYRLKLDPLRGPDPLHLEQGRVGHEILAGVVRRAMDAGRPVRELSDERWLKFLAEAIAEFKAEQPPAPFHAQTRFLGGVLEEFLRELVLVHAERWRRGDFAPVAVEQSFGGDGPNEWPALELQVGDGPPVRVRGRIDRIDAADGPDGRRLLVYDYKSSLIRLRDAYLVDYPLQVFTYLLAVQQAQSSRARVAGALLAPLFPDLGILVKAYFQKADERDRALLLYRPRGRFDQAVAGWLDVNHEVGASPVAAMARKKDGDFYLRADARPAAEIESRLTLAQRTLEQAVAGVRIGGVEVAPLRTGSALACKHCDFQPLCRFEAGRNTIRDAPQALPTPSEAGCSGDELP